MKRLILTAAIVLASIFTQAQGTDLTKNATVQKDTTIAKVAYKIYIGSRGGRFIIVTSAKGTQYKRYLPAAKK